jgi:hypothetical protein
VGFLQGWLGGREIAGFLGDVIHFRKGAGLLGSLIPGGGLASRLLSVLFPQISKKGLEGTLNQCLAQGSLVAWGGETLRQPIQSLEDKGLSEDFREHLWL